MDFVEHHTPLLPHIRSYFNNSNRHLDRLGAVALPELDLASQHRITTELPRSRVLNFLPPQKSFSADADPTSVATPPAGHDIYPSYNNSDSSHVQSNSKLSLLLPHHKNRNHFNQLSSDRKLKSGESFMPLLKCTYSAGPCFVHFQVTPKAAKVPEVTVHISAIVFTWVHSQRLGDKINVLRMCYSSCN